MPPAAAVAGWPGVGRRRSADPREAPDPRSIPRDASSARPDLGQIDRRHAKEVAAPAQQPVPDVESPADLVLAGEPAAPRSSMRQVLAVVPPMSKEMTLGMPRYFPSAAAPMTPAAGPDSIESTGRLPRDMGPHGSAARLHDRDRRGQLHLGEAALQLREITPDDRLDVRVR